MAEADSRKPGQLTPQRTVKPLAPRQSLGWLEWDGPKSQKKQSS